MVLKFVCEDPRAASRPVKRRQSANSFICYRNHLQSNNPGQPATQISTLASDSWSTMDAEMKRHWDENSIKKKHGKSILINDIGMENARNVVELVEEHGNYLFVNTVISCHSAHGMKEKITSDSEEIEELLYKEIEQTLASAGSLGFNNF
ncbi:9157_t:CDS:1 [Acaulospora colombiana]|uniref:9157_t:CDS:1 n=1 Tax=Acaulospora colombiana TaxID=27376 RepID=A0ACA9M0P8_9GLOM|nr:9157_t:CDS:1 [Acaulospora colombiana]